MAAALCMPAMPTLTSMRGGTMFAAGGSAMIGAGATAERLLREQAIAEAAELFGQYGGAASEMLTGYIHDPTLSAAERRRHRLARIEVERLARERRDAHSSHALVVWRPSFFSWRGIGALFGRKRNGRSRSRR